jgi:hypothetical protein
VSLLPNTLTAVRPVLRRWNQVDLPAVMGAIEVSIARRLTDAAFQFVPEAERVEIRMDVNNVASARVPLRLGFELDGEEQREIVTPGHTGQGLVWSTVRSRWTALSAS